MHYKDLRFAGAVFQGENDECIAPFISEKFKKGNRMEEVAGTISYLFPPPTALCLLVSLFEALHI